MTWAGRKSAIIAKPATEMWPPPTSMPSPGPEVLGATVIPKKIGPQKMGSKMFEIFFDHKP